MTSTEGKTSCKEWGTDGWGGYERVLCSAEIEHYISKVLTQRVERTNGILRQQTGRWHRRQNKFSKLWQQTEVTLRLPTNLCKSGQPCFWVICDVVEMAGFDGCPDLHRFLSRLVISYFNWIWQHSCLGTTAAQRAELTERPWTWNDIVTYPTLV